jgi:hypothetical protein
MDTVSAADTIEGVPPVLRSYTAEAIEHERRMVRQAPPDHKAKSFSQASIELLRLANKEGSHGRQFIVDQLQEIATEAGIDDDTAQLIMSDAAKAPPDLFPLTNGNAAAEAPLPQPTPTPVLLSKAQFLDRFLPPDYLIEGIIQRGFIYSLTGRTGDGKTAVAVYIAKLVSDRKSKNPLFGSCAVEHGNVIYFAGENADDLRMRMLAGDAVDGRDGSTDTLHIIEGVFTIEQLHAACKAWAEKSGKPIDLIIVDTAAAYFDGDSDNDNTQQGSYARRLRTLAALPGKPTVIVLCHPIKHATEPGHLSPRGGGAFVNEVDGNLIVWRTDQLIEFHWRIKFRGADFEPVTFRLDEITCAEIINSKGRPMRSVRVLPVTEGDQQQIVQSARAEEDRLLVALLEPDHSIAQLAISCGWLHKDGTPYKTKVQRRLAALAKEGLAKPVRGEWELSENGNAAAAKAKRAQ